jgi:hypothetical protein
MERRENKEKNSYQKNGDKQGADLETINVKSLQLLAFPPENLHLYNRTIPSLSASWSVGGLENAVFS